ncbi:MAG: 1-acyl-sn-glycerol-3-phosphate acyltransferase [Symploca sp. SIO3C6]|nr:1-acyl-sn-glycerol-3-phosphate acyltransferase [Symploca sp. SIO3C6]NET07974.1 1-acyl-sn-glycerol-3-phosphate acyltransferase [Symploca sp. SIO2B6]
MSKVQPPLEFIPPAFNPLVLRVAKRVLPFLLRRQTQITQIQADDVEILVDLYRQFQEGKSRFLIAFRHPSIDDPFCMSYLLWQLVPEVAKQQGISLLKPIHAHFIYDRGIPLWAGSQVGWIYSRLGCTPIQRGKADWMGLRSARNLFANGKLPMAAAPEGATNGHTEVISPLEPGIAQLSFWCIEDLLKAERSQQVLIVPVGIQYSYIEAPWQSLEQLLYQLEADSGLSTVELKVQGGNQLANTQASEALLYQRLYRLGEHLLSLMEDFYTRFYHQTLPTIEEKTLSTLEEIPSNANQILATRLQALLDVALKVAEEYFDLKARGGLIDRCRRLEQVGWDYIFREEFKNTNNLSSVEYGLANRIAEEANLRMWHMRLVESFVAVTGYYVAEKPTVERFAETTMLLWDTITKIKGHTSFKRPRLGKQRVQMKVGQPISVGEYYPAYKESRSGAKQAVAQLTRDLQLALEGLISPSE